MRSHFDPPTPPDALLSLEDPIAMAALAAAEEHLKTLRLQRSLLFIVDLFERHPAIQTVGFDVEEADSPSHASQINALSNRSSRFQFNFAASHLCNRVKPDPDLTIAMTPEDQEAEAFLISICRGLLHENETRLHRVVFSRPDQEPIICSIMRTGLPPSLFAAWERSWLASHRPEALGSANPPRPRPSL